MKNVPKSVIDDLLANVIESVEDTVHSIAAGGPGSGRHCEVCNVSTKSNLCPKCDEAVDRYSKYNGISNADAIQDAKALYSVHGENFLRRYATSFQGDLADTLKQSLKQALHAEGEVTYPKDHKAAMQVPKGGSSCASCKYVSTDKKECSNEYFQKYNGSKVLPLPAYEYCSDWYEPKKDIASATEVSLEGNQKGSIWNGVRIIGFTGPEEEGLRAMLSRVPPELLFNVKEIKSARELNAKHGQFLPETKTVLFNPHDFQLRQRFGKGPGWILHQELTVVHEIAHSIYEALSSERKQEWLDLSGWQKGWKLGQAPAYEEKRPGWGNAISQWTHAAGVKFPRHYSERNPNEHFSDCLAFFILNKGYQMEKAHRDFMERLVKGYVKKYTSTSIQSPAHPYPEQAAISKARSV